MRKNKGDASLKRSPSEPSMSYELEAACHNMSKHVLRVHLDAKFGADRWQHAGMGLPSRDEGGVHYISNEELSGLSVVAGLIEMRHQLAAFDALPATLQLFTEEAA